MGLESTIVCVDNSDYMRNGDYIPTRLQAQQDAVNLVCHAKMRQHPENNVGLVTLGGGRVLLTLTSDVGKILTRLHEVQPQGNITFLSAIRIAQLALKHRQGKNHKQRIVAFVGSPIDCDDKELVKLAKRLKKEKVHVDIVNFGEESANEAKLGKFIESVNGKDGTNSHLVNVPPGPSLSDALMQSAIFAGEDGQPSVGSMGGGFGFDFDPNEDPELALALRVSMEEQRARQEAESRKGGSESTGDDAAGKDAASSEEAMLQSALTMSVDPSPMSASYTPDNFANLTEEQQIALALQMSLADNETMDTETTPAAETEKKDESDDQDYAEALDDPNFLEGVLQNLPGVDTQSAAIQSAMSELTKKDQKNDGKDKDGDAKQ